MNERRLHARFFEEGVVYSVPVAVVIKSRQASFERLVPGSVEGGRVQIGRTALERMEEGTGHACENGVPVPQAEQRIEQEHER